MSLQDFEQNQPFACRFFEQALQSKSLAHAYVFKGRQIEEMYALAQELAKVLNCQNPTSATEPCNQCTDCHWISANSHPGVITISRLTFLADPDGRSPSFYTEEQLKSLAQKNTQQKMISTAQIGLLMYQVSMASQHCRVIIFTDAEVMGAEAAERQGKSSIVPPYDWRSLSENEGKQFLLRPLNRSLFNAQSANRFLKTLEEPPPNTLFIFLTDSEENLLETIVSRCQVVPFLSRPVDEEGLFPEKHRSFFQQLTMKLGQSPDFYPLVEFFEDFMVTQEGLTHLQALDAFQQHLHIEFKYQALEHQTLKRYTLWQRQIELAKKRLMAKTNTEQTLNSLFFTLTKR